MKSKSLKCKHYLKLYWQHQGRETGPTVLGLHFFTAVPSMLEEVSFSCQLQHYSRSQSTMKVCAIWTTQSGGLRKEGSSCATWSLPFKFSCRRIAENGEINTQNPELSQHTIPTVIFLSQNGLVGLPKTEPYQHQNEESRGFGETLGFILINEK